MELTANLSEQERKELSLSRQLDDERNQLKESKFRMERAQALTEEMQVRCAETASKYSAAQAEITKLSDEVQVTQKKQAGLIAMLVAIITTCSIMNPELAFVFTLNILG